MALRILHLTGSPTSVAFDDLSRLYARDCLAAIDDRDRYEPLVAHVGPDGIWRFPADLSDRALAQANPFSVVDAVHRITELDVDVMVPHMFCPAGMTTYRALFDLLGIPYVGNTPDVMALGARKDLARAAVAAAGVPVPPATLLAPGEAPPALSAPAVVKPVDADNSAGVSLVEDETELENALEDAFAAGSAALIETFIPPGRELRAGVLDRDGELFALPLEEYPVSDGRPIRAGADKLARDGDGELGLVAKGAAHAWIVDGADPVVARVQELAQRCHRAMGCRDYSLFDFRIDPEGRAWFLEAGLYCSYSPKSVVATMAAAAAIPLAELFADGVGRALARGSVTREAV